jgi:hypothetical protein
MGYVFSLFRVNMSYIEKAKANREVADNCMKGNRNKECIAASRYYYAALLFVRGYLDSYGENPKEVYHTTKYNGDEPVQPSIWLIVQETLKVGDCRIKTLRDFETSYRKLRVRADYDATYFNEGDNNILDLLRNDVGFLFEELKYYGQD